MKDLNKDYIYLLEEHGLADVSDNYKKHIKALISGNIENISFVRPPQRNESEHVVSTMSVEAAFDDYMNLESELIRVSKLLRKELLQNHGKWAFSGSLTRHSFDTPMLKVFFRQLIFGPQGMNRGGKRDDQVDKTVDVMIQLLLGNVKTDRQVKYKPKTDKGYRRMVETPFSLGLSLLFHSKTRSKMLIDDLADMTLGKTYKTTMNAEKMIESAANIYSPATLRQVYGRKAFKRGIEYHVINLLSIYYLQFDAVMADNSASDELRIKSV